MFGGWLFAALLGGLLSDKIGRKPVVMLFMFTCSLFGLLASFPNHFWLFMLFRLLAGVSIGESKASLEKLSYFDVSPIDHFTVVCSVITPLNVSEAGVDFVLIQTSLLLLR